MKKQKNLVRLIAFCIPLVGCNSDKPLQVSKMSNGVTIQIETVAGDLGRRKCNKLTEEAVRVFDQRMSHGYSENSVINRLNDEREVTDLPDEMMQFFESLDRLRQRTNNAWFPATGKVHELWESQSGVLSEPDPEELSLACDRVQNTGVNLTGEGKAILQGEGDLALDYALLGWSVDGAAQTLLNGQIPAAFIQAGDVYRFWGQPKPDSLWTFKIKTLPDTTVYHMTPDAGGICRIISGNGTTDSENLLKLNIYNPETGYPARELSSLTAWAPDAISACVYAEAMNVMIKTDMLRWAERHDSVSVFVVDNDLAGALAESDSRMSVWISMYKPW